LPEINASGASGRIIPNISGSNPINFPDGLEFTVDRTGLRGRVAGAQQIVAGASIAVSMIDTGSASNADPFEKITFVSPPNNVSTQAEVDLDGLTGGTDN